MLGPPESALQVDPTSRTAGPLWPRGFFLVQHGGCKIPGMRAFEVDAGSPADFVDQVGRVLAERELDSYVGLRLDGDELVVRFRWMGSSELRYVLSEIESGFRADLDDVRMSPFHAPFRQRFNERLDQVLAEVGARSV